MADSTAPQETTDSNPQRETESIDPKPQPDPSTEPTPAQQPSTSSSSIPPPSSNPSTPQPPSLISPPSIQPYPVPSFRPATPPAPVPGTTPQFSPIPNPNLQQTQNYQTTGIPPPGVSSVSPVMMAPPAAAPATGAGVVQMGYVQSPFALPGQPMRPYAQMPNGYPAMPQPLSQGGTPPPGIPRYPSPYTPMVRPVYPPRPPIGVGIVPPVMRPLVPVIRGPVTPPVIRPAPSPITTQTEKPQTTVYVGKISSTVENDFMLSLLQLCGPVKSWKRAQDPTNGMLKGFGFCEFESAEGVLRALRLLSKLNIDGQELMLNVNQATRGYLEQYVQKKVESSTKPNEHDTGGGDKGEDNVPDAEKSEASKNSSEHPEPTSEDAKKDKENENKENHDTKTFGLVTDEDRQADQEALEKLTDMIKERLKNKPLPPPPPPPQLLSTDAGGNLNVENRSRSRDGESDADAVKSEKNEDDLTSESKPSSEHDRDETSSPDHRRLDRKSRDRDWDIKREKERELERYEREREQERAKREKEREYKIRDDERRYKVREKEWESREREKEHWRKREREREKDRAHERKLEIMEQEHDGDDGYKRRKYRSSSDEERKRRHREKEDDLADRLKEEEEIADAKWRDDEQQRKKEQEEALKILSGHVANGHDRAVSPEKNNHEDKSVLIASDANLSHGEVLAHNGIGDESVWPTTAASDMRQSGNAPAKKLGFGLQGSGKRAAVPSVFNEDEDEDTQKEKKMRPLVPIDYSTEEQRVVHPSISEAPSLNSAAATEAAKRISIVNAKEERLDAEKDRSRRSHERFSHRERERHDEESRKENVDHDRAREHRPDKVRTPDNQKLLDAKQLIDMIPKTKHELFSYEINWAIYDKNELHERMRPWIAKKITEFLGEEEPTLVDYIVSSTQEHVKASEMLERLQAILDEEAEMFVLKMWRMLIFEIKKVETGLAARSKS